MPDPGTPEDSENEGGRGRPGGSATETGAPAANPVAAPGSSGPGEQGYSGAATIGDEGAVAGDEAYADPFGRPDSGETDASGGGEGNPS